MTLYRAAVLICVPLLTANPAPAQYSKLVVFGDSGSDSGYYKTTPPMSNPAPPGTSQPLTVPPNAGRFTTNPGLNWTELLAQHLGLNANPSNTPGGTNYAVGGARVNAAGVPTVTFANVPSVHNQISTYLTASGPEVDRKALYVLLAGGNDNAVAFKLFPNSLVDQLSIVTKAATDLAHEVRRLHAAGARHIVLGNLFTGPMAGRGAHIRNDTFNATLFNSVTAAGIYVIRANIQGKIFSVYDDPTTFGLTSQTIQLNNPACVAHAANPSFADHWQNALWCLPENLVTTSAANDHLFADTHGHFSTVGQQIIAGFVSDLVQKGPGPLSASVLPYARSTLIGKSAIATADVKNNASTTATGCTVALPPGIAATLTYRAVDGANVPIAAQDTPVDIAPGATRRFTFEVMPALGPGQVEIGLAFSCARTAPAAVIPGRNTFIVSTSPTPPPGLEAQFDAPGGTVNVVVPGSVTIFAKATNHGPSGSITASVDDGGRKLGMTMVICRMNPANTACSSPPAPSTPAVTVAANATVTYRVTATPTAPLLSDPAISRLFLRLRTPDGYTRGAASVAVIKP
jgi:phospholipase/lecithinase/hemolysin